MRIGRIVSKPIGVITNSEKKGGLLIFLRDPAEVYTSHSLHPLYDLVSCKIYCNFLAILEVSYEIK